MLFIYLFYGGLYFDQWKSDLYFRSATPMCVPGFEYASFLACQKAIVDLPIMLKGNSKHTSTSGVLAVVRLCLGCRLRFEQCIE